MPINDDLGQRMKSYYEGVSKTRLLRRTPVAIRIDGKAFHTFTKGFEKPFDMILVKSMQETMLEMCKNIQGCVFGYTQSDEITLILIDYQKLDTSAWFDYEVQKMCSVAASMATLYFNKFFDNNYLDEIAAVGELSEYALAHDIARRKGAVFDARCFNIPKAEVGNLLYWRQLDATRNSIQMVGQANFSHKELQHKTCNDIQNMLLTQKDINWNDFPIYLKRGTACFKSLWKPGKTYPIIYERKRWVMDKEMPILTHDWTYVDKHIYVGV